MVMRFDGIVIDRGSTVPRLQFRFLIDGTGSEWRLTLLPSRGERIELSTEDDTLTAAVATVDGVTTTTITWARTVEQSRLIPRGALTSYELEQIEPGGGQRLCLEGIIKGQGGLNDD
ncbi:MAG: hypothetical protein ABII76_05450 [Pseudomonadota bacterium]